MMIHFKIWIKIVIIIIHIIRKLS